MRSMFVLGLVLIGLLALGGAALTVTTASVGISVDTCGPESPTCAGFGGEAHLCDTGNPGCEGG